MSIIPYPEGLNKWAGHKQQASIVAETLRKCKIAPRLSMSPKDIQQYWIMRADNMANCASVLIYNYCRECGSMHIARSYLCRDRLCPVCSWRLSLQRAGEMWLSLQKIYESGSPVNAAMITLTAKSVTGENLEKSIDELLSAWARLRKRRAWSRWVAGYARSLEVTIGKGGYHPHMHVLVLWADGYDRQITQRQICDMWGDALRVDYTPICDIRRAYNKAPDGQTSEWERTMNAAIECCKYAVSGKITTSATPDQLGYIARALKGRRLIAYGGIIADARATLSLDDDDTPADISEITITCPKCGSDDVISITYQWATGGYLMGIPYAIQK